MVKYILVFLLSWPLFSAPCDSFFRLDVPDQWSQTSLTRKGVVLSIHGLNIRPRKMLDLTNYLNQLGYDVLNMALYGHQGDLQEMKSASYQIFYDHARSYLCELIRRAGDDPIIFLGHSTGAVLQGNLLYQFSQLADRQLQIIWLAPAFRLRWPARLISILSGSLILPSLGPKSYQANYGTSLNAYFALSEGIEKFEKHFLDGPQVLPPTLIVMDPEDELIDWEQSQKFFSKASWIKFAPISNQSSQLPGKRRHLIIDRASLGKSGWKRLTHLIQKFLQGI